MSPCQTKSTLTHWVSQASSPNIQTEAYGLAGSKKPDRRRDRDCGASPSSMKLPNTEHAVVDVRKLRDYCLSSEHPRDRHKAHLFSAALGFTADHAEQLQRALLEAARTADAISVGKDDYGQRYALDSLVQGPTGAATVRSLWMIRRGENFPRLITCYVV